MKSVNEALKVHFASKTLSSSQITELQARQTAKFPLQKKLVVVAASNNKISRFFNGLTDFRYAFYVTACMLLVCLMVTFNLINQTSPSQRIMDEIAYNHKQDMPIEIASNSLSEIREFLNRLNFPIITPIAFTKPNWQFLGGRYCLINGKIAAQLKVKNLTNNNAYTLYQAATDSGEEHSEIALTEMIDGVGVSIWREKGLLLGLASSP